MKKNKSKTNKKAKTAKVKGYSRAMSEDHTTKPPNKMVMCLPDGEALTLTSKQFRERNEAFFGARKPGKPTKLQRQESKAVRTTVDSLEMAAGNIEWLIALYEKRLKDAKEAGIKVVEPKPKQLLALPPSKIKSILEHGWTPAGQASNALYSLPYLQEAAKRLKALMSDLDAVLPIYTV